jgi:hypothetical protein
VSPTLEVSDEPVNNRQTIGWQGDWLCLQQMSISRSEEQQTGCGRKRPWPIIRNYLDDGQACQYIRTPGRPSNPVTPGYEAEHQVIPSCVVHAPSASYFLIGHINYVREVQILEHVCLLSGAGCHRSKQHGPPLCVGNPHGNRNRNNLP